MKPASKLTLLYTISGITWILLSDQLAFYLFGDYEIYTQNLFHTTKGILYVVSTGVLLYFISSKFNRELEEKIR
jgi:hypothetical protein